MAESRTKKSFFTMATSGIRQVFTVVLAFVSRSVFIHVLGAEYLGLNGLFTNILQFLSLAELGIGAAISFYLYKPLAEKNIERIKTIMQFYKQCYRIVGLSILGLGCLLMPFLSKLVNLDQPIPENIYLIYFLYLCNSAFTYLFFAYRQTLVTANQEQYKIEKINIIYTFVNCIADIVVLILFRNFLVYLIVKIALVVLKNIIIAIKINKEYPYISEPCSAKLTKSEIKSLFNDVFSVSIFKVGCIVINSTTNIVVSAVLGTVIVGYFSNYYMVISQVSVIFNMVVQSFTASVGNVIVKETKERQYQVFKTLNFFAFCIYSVFTVCLFQLLNPFVNLWVGNVDKAYILSQGAVIMICANFFADCASQVINTFRNASGRFKTGRSFTLVGGLINIPFSIFMAKEFGLVGVLFTLPLCKLLVAIIPFFVMIGRDLFGKSAFVMLSDLFVKLTITICCCLITWFSCLSFHQSDIIGFIGETLVSAIVPGVIVFALFYRTREMSELKNKARNLIRGKL